MLKCPGFSTEKRNKTFRKAQLFTKFQVSSWLPTTGENKRPKGAEDIAQSVHTKKVNGPNTQQRYTIKIKWNCRNSDAAL